FNRDDFFQAPLGGTREQGSHKGYGFALMAEVLATALSGALPTMLSPTSGSKNQFTAYNISAFTDLDRFKDTMDEMLRTLRTTPPARSACSIRGSPRRRSSKSAAPRAFPSIARCSSGSPSARGSSA